MTADIAELGMRVDTRNVDRAGVSLDTFTSKAGRTEKSVTRSAQVIDMQLHRSMVKATKGANGMRHGVRQLGLQLNQVAQVGGMTGNWLNALAVQLPDILLGFGTFGVFAGIAAGAMIPLISTLMDSSEETKTFAEQNEDARKAINNARAAVDLMSSDSLPTLVAMYGNASQEVRSLVEDIARIKIADAFDSASGAIGNFFNQNKQISGAIKEVEDYRVAVTELQHEITSLEQQQATLSPQSSAYATNARLIKEMTADLESLEALEGVSDKFNIKPDTIQSAQTLRSEITQAMSAGLYEVALVKVAELRQQLKATSSGPLRDLGDGLVAVEDMLRQAVSAADGLENPISNASSAAANLANEVSRAVSNMNRLQLSGITSLRESELRLEHKGNPVATAGALAREKAAIDLEPLRDGASVGELVYIDEQIKKIGERAEATARNKQELSEFNKTEIEAQRLATRSTRAGASKLKKDDLRLDREKQRVLNSIKTAQDKYNDSLEILDTLLAKGKISQEEYNEALKKTQVEILGAIDPAALAASRIESISDAISGAIVRGESLGDAFKNVLAQIASDILSSNIKNLLTDLLTPGGSSGGGGGLLGGLLGGGGGSGFLNGIFGGFRASGGPVKAGVPYVVGEKRPELFVPNTSGTILPSVPQGISGGNQGQSAPNITIIDQSSGVRVTPRQMSDGELKIYIDEKIQTDSPKAVAGDLGNPSGKVSKAMSRGFGIKRDAQ